MSIIRLLRNLTIQKHAIKGLFSKSILSKLPVTIFPKYISGVYESPFNDCSIPNRITFAQHILEDFLLYDDLPAITDYTSNKTITYTELYDDIHCLANSLFTLGIKQGDVVTIYSENRSEYAIAFIASSLLGATISSVNPQYTSSELIGNFKQSNCKLVFASDNVINSTDALKKTLNAVRIQYGCVVFGDSNCLPGSLGFDGLRRAPDPGSTTSDLYTSYTNSLRWNAAEDLLALPFSSGTTGQPKATMLSHLNFISMVNILRSSDCLNYEAGKDVILGLLPFFHIFGQVIILLAPLKSGCHVIAVPKFEPKMFVDAIKTHQVNYLHLVPPIMLLLTKKNIATTEDLSSVDVMVCGAAPCHGNLLQEVQEKFDIQYVRQGYGLTEMSPVSHLATWKDTLPGSCGPSVSNTRWKIVHPETHQLIEDGEIEGELCVQGPQMMMGYLNNKKATDEAIIDGWLHTGDIAMSNKNKELMITDRVKELIKYKGIQVAPAELEALLIQHRKIDDAAVIGVKDDQGNELPRAYIVVASGVQPNSDLKEEINDYVKKHLAPFKWLRGGIVYIDEIPKSASGKILRRVLIENL